MTVGVRLPPEIKDKLQEIADKDMRTLSNLIMKILTEYLSDIEKSAEEWPGWGYGLRSKKPISGSVWSTWFFESLIY